MRHLLLAGGFSAAVAGVSSASGDPPPLGDEFQVNTYTENWQTRAAVAAAPDGEFVAVWVSYDQDGSDWGIFGQRYAADGSPRAGEFQVNSQTVGLQWTPSVAMDASGSFVVVWMGDTDGQYEGIFAQRFDSGGVPLGGEFRVNTYTPYSQRAPEVSFDPSGGFVVVWSSADGWGGGVSGQRYDPGGKPLGTEFVINTYTYELQKASDVAHDGSGNFVVVWTSRYQDGSSYGIFGQRFDAGGNHIGAEFQVNTYTPSRQYGPAVAADATGNFMVVWESWDGSSFDVRGQAFDAGGNPLGGEFKVNTHTTRDQWEPTATASPEGRFVVSWHSEDQDGSSYGVFGQMYEIASGDRVGSEFQVNTYTTSAQFRPSVSSDAAGHFVVLWTSYEQDRSLGGIFGQRYRWPVFADGFESGDTAAWDQTVP